MLIFWHFRSVFLKFRENLWIFFRLYRNKEFRRADCILRLRYLFASPYRVARREGLLYGHTPLPTMKQILQTCHIAKTSTLIDLGCGEGRAILYAQCFHVNQAIGVDLLSAFMQRTKGIESSSLHYLCKDMLDIDFSQVTDVYFFATGFSNSHLEKLGEKFESLPKGAKVITISEPLTHPKFYLWKQFEALFYFGKASVYCQVKK